MKLTAKTSIHELTEAYPFMVEFLVTYNPKYSLLKSKVARATMGRVATLEKVASIGEVGLGDLVEAIRAEVQRRTGESLQVDVGAAGEGDAARLDALKQIIHDLHDGLPLEEGKKRFDELVKDVDPAEIPRMEEELVKGGLPVAEVQRLCDVHVGVIKHALEGKQEVEAPPGHPVHTYMAENEVITGIVARIDGLLKAIGGGGAPGPELSGALAELSRIESHYVRKENQLFPFLEKHGITAPPQVMWGVHDEIRARLKEVRAAVDAGRSDEIVDKGVALTRAITEMIYKENRILFPLVMDTFTDEEWVQVRRGEDELGYAFAEPAAPWGGQGAARAPAPAASGLLDLSTGKLSLEQLDLVMTHLPVDLSFVDADGFVRYYSDGPERIFPRSPGVIGRHVEKCHPPKSVDTVKRILESFAAGDKDVAEFWIEIQGRFIHIRYFAVRDASGTYEGCLEVSQDVTHIRGLEGQRRLLDWD